MTFILLAGDAKATITWRAVHARGLKRSSTFRNYTHTLSEPGFRALLTEGDAWVLFHREGFDRPGEVSV
jgi:hypothetical protein